MGRIPKGNRQQRIGWRVDFDHRHVPRFILADEPAFIAFAIEKNDFDLSRAIDHMKVRQNMPTRVDNRARAASFGGNFEKEERIAAHAFGVNVDYAAVDLLVNGYVD